MYCSDVLVSEAQLSLLFSYFDFNAVLNRTKYLITPKHSVFILASKTHWHFHFVKRSYVAKDHVV